MQLLETTPDNSVPSDLPIFLPANNIPEQGEKLAGLVSTGKTKKRRSAPNSLTGETPFRRRCGEMFINCMRNTTKRKTTEPLIMIKLFDARQQSHWYAPQSGWSGSFGKDMQEEFITNSVLLWKLCKKTYNMQGDFFITNSAFPSVAGITALPCGRLLVVANAALNLQPKTLFKKKKKQ